MKVVYIEYERSEESKALCPAEDRQTESNFEKEIVELMDLYGMSQQIGAFWGNRPNEPTVRYCRFIRQK